MKVGVFQFRGSGSITGNHKAIVRAITIASQNKVRLLVFQECASCGYPPVEIAAIDKIDFEIMNSYLQEVKQLAKYYDMYIALGTIRDQNSRYYNSIHIFPQ